MTVDVARIVAPLARIPATYRRYNVTVADAGPIHGVDAQLCQRLIELGLPHVGEGPDALFDENDLGSVALHLRLRSVRRFTMGFWLESLERLRQGPTRYRVTVRASCPTPWHGGLCHFEVLAGENEYRAIRTDRRRVQVAETTVDVVERPYTVPHRLHGLIEDFSDLDFYLLPFPLADDEEFLMKERIGTCPLVARTLAKEARRCGFEARTAYGLIVSAPYSQAHCWAEIAVDGRWVAVDPLMPRALRSFGLSDETRWPATLSPAGLYHRLDASGPLVTHLGAECPMSLATQAVP